jgi:hypothetical protein
MDERTKVPEWLDSRARVIFEKTLPRVTDIDHPQKIAMLSAWSEAQAKMADLSSDRDRFKLWRRAAIYAGNHLGLNEPIFMDFLELLCDEGLGGEIVTGHLDPGWEIGRPEDYPDTPLEIDRR